MTLGERIQAQRKERGLSQEALGEALGVSRQAISKWESDTAIPEVDKLIALSRIFGVSVGALLGVEEENPAAPEELTDRELRAVEEIVRRYVGELNRRPPPTPRWKQWLWPAVAAALAAAVAAGWISLSEHIDSLNHRYVSLQNSLYRLEETVEHQSHQLASQVEETLERQNNLIAEWTYYVEEMRPEEGVGTVAVSLTPRQHTEGMTAVVSALLNDGSRYSAQGATVDGPAPSFLARLELPLADAEAVCAVTFSVTLTAGETSQTQLLDEVYNLIYDDELLALGANYSGGMSYSGDSVTKLRWNGEMHWHIAILPPAAPYEGLMELPPQPETAELRWYLDGALDRSIPLRFTWTEEEGSAAGVEPVAMLLDTGEARQVDVVFRITDRLGGVTEYLVKRQVLTGEGQWERMDDGYLLPAPIQP